LKFLTSHAGVLVCITPTPARDCETSRRASAADGTGNGDRRRDRAPTGVQPATGVFRLGLSSGALSPRGQGSVV
jgi:hypothetical protein